MKRAIEQDLLYWKNKPRRSPLLLLGARQVGKTYVVHKIGKEAFESLSQLTLSKTLNLRVVLKRLSQKKF